MVMEARKLLLWRFDGGVCCSITHQLMGRHTLEEKGREPTTILGLNLNLELDQGTTLERKPFSSYGF